MVLAAVSGCSTAGPVRPVSDILMVAGAYRVGRRGRTDLYFLSDGKINMRHRVNCRM